MAGVFAPVAKGKGTNASEGTERQLAYLQAR